MSKIYVTGIGPGLYEHMTEAAKASLEDADIIVGYKTYIDIIADLIGDKEVLSSGMRREIDRCEKALELAEQGKKICLVSSGDAGVFGMAGIMLEIVEAKNSDVEVEIIPGISAANAAASTLGAPLMHDYAVISLSDLLTDWAVIEKRLHCAGEGDFIITLYNPKSKGRPHNIESAQKILLEYKAPETPVGIVRNAKRKDESYVITTLKKMNEADIDMFSMVIIGNSKTYVTRDQLKMITPRGYQL
ncbi:precorrin-3B C(17)-methyltransferase [Acetobacterium sp.]|uniref:precorrin-3B C(17)-methyltransferase n=1 Tax=Acetobacterium sp. TaxID=1872094 RepID=UPI002719734B|nr:precorrin-3B C(17)-methyltransferase [Acetobacterium sp.]MDO9493262.1 precorrin-3B C(17)-methyltransferase [Acetobacterium sp.]